MNELKFYYPADTLQGAKATIPTITQIVWPVACTKFQQLQIMALSISITMEPAI